MKREPKQSNQYQNYKICDECAWTDDRIHSEDGGIKYYCYYFDKIFKWEFEKRTKEGFLLKMKPCSAFHTIPKKDMNRGAEFAKYFQNKYQIEASSTRSWISIIIALIATIVSIIGLCIRNSQ